MGTCRQCVSLVIAFGLLTFGQEASRPKFDVLSVKLASKSDRGFGQFIEQGRLRFVNASMRTLLMLAFHVSDYQLAIPAWTNQMDAVNSQMGGEHYMIEATFPKGTSLDTIRLMYQSMLIDRFKLSYHSEQRNIKGFVLRVDPKGSKLEKSAGAKDVYVGGGNGLLKGDPMSPESLTTQLEQIVSAPVVDETHIEGDFKISVRYAPDNAPPGATGPSIFTAIRQGLGLYLQPSNLKIDVLVVDKVNRIPSEN